ncbi:MAG: M28 family peptidase [Acidobacteria bacterium]|nr:MAG: M28 family peptidase [Acidobacteriota bacterium]
MNRDALLAGMAVLIIVGGCVLGIHLHRPPEALGEDVPLTEFSAARAMNELRNIAGRAHPIGSPANLGVRDYIVRRLTILGGEPEVQQTTVVNGWRVVDVENVVVRFPGSASTKAVLLVAHYDSVPMSPGAGDAGSAVATLLETYRALAAGGPLRNDVLFLFTNPEEVFLHGGTAFVEQHPWFQDVGLVVNMDPGGTSGPAYLHGTSDQNGWLIGEFARAVPYPMGTSLAFGIKKLLGDRNDEFHLFTDAGIPGFNISFIAGDTRYHTPLDTPDNLDQRSLQHLGSYALSLVRYFGHRVLEDRREADQVYFNAFGTFFVHYPEAYVLPMTVGVVVLFLVVCVLGLFTRCLTVAGVGLGFGVFVGALALAPLAVMGIWWLLKSKLGVYDAFLTGNIYNSPFYLLGFTLIAVGVAASLYAMVLRATSMENLAVGAYLGWVAMSVSAAIYLPGGSYLFLWPVFFSLLAMAVAFPKPPDRKVSDIGPVVLMAGAIPALVLVSSHLLPVFTALSMDEAPYLMMLPVALVGLVVPLVCYILEPHRWALPGICLVAGLVVLGMAVAVHAYEPAHPQTTFLVYALDADEGEAVWATRSRAVELSEPDPWARQMFPDGARSEMFKFYPWTRAIYLQGDAPVEQLDPPTAELVKETRGPEGRTLHLRIRSPRKAAILIAVTDREMKSWSLGELSVGSRQIMAYWAFPDAGFELTLEVGDTDPLKLILIDQSYGLPDDVPARPDHMMQEPSGGLRFTDATLVRKSYSF